MIGGPNLRRVQVEPSLAQYTISCLRVCRFRVAFPSSAERTTTKTWYLFYNCFRRLIDDSHLDMLYLLMQPRTRLSLLILCHKKRCLYRSESVSWLRRAKKCLNLLLFFQRGTKSPARLAYTGWYRKKGAFDAFLWYPYFYLGLKHGVCL